MKKFLAILLALAICLSVISVATFAAENTVTVHAYVPDSWSKVYLYYWEGGAGWPGSVMTKGNDGWYTGKIPASGVDGVIINNGAGTQTADITSKNIDLTKEFWLVVAADGTYTATASKPGNTNTEVKMRDVYAKVPSGWIKANLYAWSSSQYSSWPGSAMTKGNDGWYHLQIPASFNNLIVNNGSAQTSDLKLTTAQDAADALWIDLSSNLSAPTITTSKPSGGSTPSTPVETKYSVAGSKDLCGVEWTPGNADNTMTKGNDGLYTITYTNVPAGEHKFKVTDGTWDNCWGDSKEPDADGNYVLNLTAVSNVTITFNSTTKEITVTTEAVGGVEPTEPEVTNPPVYYVAGTEELCGSNWNPTDTKNKMLEDERGCYTITYTDVPAGEHKFKVTDGTWDNCWGDSKEPDADGNYVLNLTGVSTVTITFDPDIKLVSVNVETEEVPPVRPSGVEFMLVTNADWNQDNARFAVYLFDGAGNEAWVDCDASLDFKGLWYVTVPAEFVGGKMIFCRMDPSKTENIWDNKWNQTADLEIPAADTEENCFLITGWDTGKWVPFSLEILEHQYNIIGTINGDDWSVGHVMTKNADGTWTLTLDVKAGTYVYKVNSNNGYWLPGDDRTLVVAEDSSVTFTFDLEKNDVTHVITPKATEPEETEPEETEPEETKPAATEPEETKPAATEPEETKPAATEPEETKPAATEPEETEPAATEPEETKPAATEPEETKPAATEPEETKPAATEPEETKPAATEPEETKPAATEPEETKPAATEPKPTVPDNPDTVVVYAKVPESWTDVGVYVWDASGKYDAPWPGIKMTKGEDGWYTAEVPSWAENIIINNNGNGAQTQDMPITVGVDLWIEVVASDSGFTGTVSYESAKTGDSTNIVALAAAMLFAAAGMVTLIAKKKEF